mmetsp:Transcript_15771/g.23183  ORF Transcript_15771/g.23183 Transcript_15771/m.23183 type:complete len:266 (-) Transcript_15771:459-1256(-)
MFTRIFVFDLPLAASRASSATPGRNFCPIWPTLCFTLSTSPCRLVVMFPKPLSTTLVVLPRDSDTTLLTALRSLTSTAPSLTVSSTSRKTSQATCSSSPDRNCFCTLPASLARSWMRSRFSLAFLSSSFFSASSVISLRSFFRFFSRTSSSTFTSLASTLVSFERAFTPRPSSCLRSRSTCMAWCQGSASSCCAPCTASCCSSFTSFLTPSTSPATPCLSLSTSIPFSRPGPPFFLAPPGACPSVVVGSLKVSFEVAISTDRLDK